VEKNANDWSKKEGSRLSLFLADEKPRLQPLPDSPFHRIIEKPAVVSRDFHLQYSNAFYSVPVDYVGKTVTVRDDGTTIRIYSDKGKLIAEHRKAVKKWQRCTDEKHISKGHDHDNKAYSLEYFSLLGGEVRAEHRQAVSGDSERLQVPRSGIQNAPDDSE
jgi:hypothetical protein